MIAAIYDDTEASYHSFVPHYTSWYQEKRVRLSALFPRFIVQGTREDSLAHVIPGEASDEMQRDERHLQCKARRHDFGGALGN